MSPVRVAVLATVLAACGGGDDDGGGAPDAAGPGEDDAGAADRATDHVANRAGWIELVEDASVGSTMSAGLRDGADVPPATLLASQGECEIWTHPLAPASCDPPCTDGFCVAEDECTRFPQVASAGTITITGATEALAFTSGEFGYQPDPDIPPADLFADDAAVSATAPGDEAPGFTLAAAGVPPLVADLDLESDVTLVLEDGVSREVRWTAESRGTIQVGLQVGWHGAVYEALMVCESDDDGSLVIPGELVSQFPRASNGMEQHGSWIRRLERDRVATDAGTIELVVASQVRIPQISHP
jgi:hypothetical protein